MMIFGVITVLTTLPLFVAPLSHNPPSRCRTFGQRLDDGAVAELLREDCVVVENFLTKGEIDGFRKDAMKLRESGAFVPSGVGIRELRDGVHKKSSKSKDLRVSETGWLRPPPWPHLGDVTARRHLDAVLEDLQKTIAGASGEDLFRSVSDDVISLDSLS